MATMEDTTTDKYDDPFVVETMRLLWLHLSENVME